MKSLMTALVLAAFAMTGVVGQALAHHKPGYHGPVVKKPQTPQVPRPPAR